MRLLRRLLRRNPPAPAHLPNALPPEPSDDAPEWLMERLGNGVKRHFPASSPVERGPAVVAPATPPVPQPAPLFSPAGHMYDGTAGRTP
jgi:hypothetical protein